MVDTNSARGRLAGAAHTLLDPGASRERLRDAARALFERCSELAGPLSEGGGQVEGRARLPDGLAVPPPLAAACILDELRTARFLQGLAAAIEVARTRFGEPVEVLYAGCGPFAPLFLPLAALLPEGSARFMLLDAQPQAIDCVRRLTRACGLAQWLDTAEVADACAWRPPRPPHVLVTESMLAGLRDEGQVAILRALAPQLAPGGLIVPEELTLEACLVDMALGSGALAAQPRRSLGEVLRLRADDLRRGLPLDERPAPWPTAPGIRRPAAERALPAVRLSVPDDAGYALHVLLLTRVRLFGSLELCEGDSGLTCPIVMAALGRVDPGDVLEFRYLLGSAPQLDARVVM
jgi:hypothetical protein